MNAELKQVTEDIKRYLLLCERFNEVCQTKPDRFGNAVPDCYGPHATVLHTRANAPPRAKKGASGKAAPRRSTTQRRSI